MLVLIRNHSLLVLHTNIAEQLQMLVLSRNHSLLVLRTNIAEQLQILVLSRNHTLYHSSYCYFMFHYYCFACMDLDISVPLIYFSLVLCCLTELLFLYRSLTLIFYFIGVGFFSIPMVNIL